ncbi:S9 family peptidase [Diaphorobacter ruginosibacter]|uniref:S9 family peptidase n=1 Tax=Diaphorobacter ruginosibacter TaxID=1715720 RepID=A0A7G9RNZ6_9BURK|nr:S9 family peptidase [Diaphorobacter ruginosibacter]QNN57321.1 S9 family peptidase [Diaphorobacter ruginosibacter]
MSNTPQTPRQYPLRDFFKNPERGYYRLSDDGRTLGFMQPAGAARRMNLFVQPLDGEKLVGEPRQLTHETERDLAGYVFKGNDVVLFSKDFGGDENFHVLAANVRTGEVRDLTPWDKVRASIEDDLEDDADHVLVGHNQRNPEVFDVYRVNIHTGASERVAENPGNIIGWQTDHDGRLRAAVASDGLMSVVLYRDSESEAFRPIIETDFRVNVGPAFFDFDNQGLYLYSARGRDKMAFVRIDPARPDDEQVVYANDEVDLDGVGYSHKRKVLTAASYQTDRLHLHFFDETTRMVHAQLARQLPGYEIHLQASDKDENVFIVAAVNDRTPGRRYLYDARRDALTLLGEMNPAIAEADMAHMQPIQYPSRDGLTIHGYLTLPPGRSPGEKLPVVINPHGGPWARDSWGFNPEVQFLANRGYAVLQMNFRGSTGYGRKFWEASFGQWGLSMQDDITDGVQWLIDQGIADPARIAIYGASYGGYATLAGVTLTPDLYAAAVDYVGVSNLFTFLGTIPPYWKPMLDKMQAMVGDPVKDKARLEATSPALLADRIQTPLFVAQGAQDPRVNKAESDQMVAALKARGVEVEYMVKDNEGHGFHNDENKFEFYEAMERFLALHLKQ